MIRKIININKEKCNGCGLCVTACHEGAIELINGKATLSNEHYCDGLGDCLPACPTGAITFEEREAPAYDEQAVLNAKALKQAKLNFANESAVEYETTQSQLNQWPTTQTARYIQGRKVRMEIPDRIRRWHQTLVSGFP